MTTATLIVSRDLARHEKHAGGNVMVVTPETAMCGYGFDLVLIDCELDEDNRNRFLCRVNPGGVFLNLTE